MSDVIRGLWAAMATPLDAEGHIDHAALARHGLALLDQGCDGLVPFGTTGEGPSFSAAERLAATEALLKAGVQADRIALGTGCPAIPDTVALSRQAMALGLTHMLILPPYFFRDAPDEGMEDAFAAIVDGVGSDRLRATLYHIPQVSGVSVPAAVLGRLRKRFGAVIAGVKDSTGDFDSFLAFRREAPDCGALVGAEVHINRALAAGGTGTICGMANLVPDLVRAMFTDPAAEANMKAACDLITGGHFLPLVKAAIAAATGDAAWRTVRPPLRAADPARGARIAAGLAALQARRAA
ncbi:dihydrodipicolinate synthase family protein [Limobrevibacterium gyesilva]|uniref:Dihydrodipicolinate synthase family protein n=1 Tax=Limobrevibacterium gyesilva TaxID=2991712 RepID=A0AA41YPI7_9PROT|nr:dihydrodipicolinate synthase family protein [Limobrevibacterium gyesilva]MCW3474278.1 dihydrodipicolinate synthase family protein [Limobrevibacterium gyesilva]